MIPKIIHYCWFGGNPLPELAIRVGKNICLIMKSKSGMRAILISIAVLM